MGQEAEISSRSTVVDFAAGAKVSKAFAMTTSKTIASLIGYAEAEGTSQYRLASGGFGDLRLLDFNFLRLRLGRLRDHNLQDTVRHRRLDAGGIDAGR